MGKVIAVAIVAALVTFIFVPDRPDRIGDRTLVALVTIVFLTFVIDALRRGVVVFYSGPLHLSEAPVGFWFAVSMWCAVALFHVWMVLTFPAR